MGPPVITLLTDFGTRDAYAAAMKGVILARCPAAVLVDITHDIGPQDVLQAAFVLARAWTTFPTGTIHLAVVDPGVGTSRQLVAGACDGQYFLAPDNGLLPAALGPRRLEPCLAVDTAAFGLRAISATFHGRDILAPTAASLASGTPLDHLGVPCTPVTILTPWHNPPTRLPARLRGVHADRFGNLLTGVPVTDALRSGAVRVNGRAIGPIRRTYADVPEGELLALVGSDGCLEVARRNGSALAMLGLARAADAEIEVA